MHDAPSPPICGADLERWRIGNGLTKVIAADAFGLPFSKWEELISKEQMSRPIADPAVAMILQLYIEHPETAPVRQTPDVREFYAFLGLTDTPKDKEAFAALIGRSAPSVYRLLNADGKPGRPLIRWMEALRKLQMSPRATRKVMEVVASEVGYRQRYGNVLIEGWKRGKEGADDE